MKAKVDELTVRVTKADIGGIYGQHYTSDNCPVARAMNRALGIDHGYASSRLYCAVGLIGLDDVYFKLPQNAQDWIAAYDKSKSMYGRRDRVTPFNFKLTSDDIRQERGER